MGFAGCVGLLAYALYAQHVLGLDPCPLCVFQRVGVFATAIVFLVAGLHNPAKIGRVVYAVALVVSAGATAAVAARHVYLQNLPADQVPSCGAGLDFLLETTPFFDVLRQVFTGSGECAEVSWRFLGLTMPTWMLLVAIALVVYALVANLVFAPRRASVSQ